MHCIEALAAGVRGAENGTAQLFARGTSTRVTWYPDFEASSSYTTDVDLDANGGATVFVGRLTDVRVLDADGFEIRRFVAGVSATAVEVISDSFAGIDYYTAAAGVSKPTTLSEILDLWNNSAGTSGFNVLVGGSAKTLQSALAGSALYFNVKDTAYGAVGDGATDDTSAIQAAITAANAAGGGTVFFPSGSYRHTSALSLPPAVSLLGVGPQGSALQIDHATANSITASSAGTYQGLVAGLRIEPLQNNTGTRVAGAAFGFLHLTDCYLGHASRQLGDCVSGASARFVVSSCTFQLGGASSRVGSTGDWRLGSCVVNLPNGVAYNPTTGVVVGTLSLQLYGVEFGATPSSGTYSFVTSSVAGTVGIIAGCLFTGNGSATVVGITWSNTTSIVEMANTFSGTLTPYSYTAANLSSTTLATRSSAKSTATVAGNTTLASDQYGEIVASVTVNTALVLTLSAAPLGSKFTLVIDNDFAGTTGNITFAADVRGLTTETLLINEIDVYNFLRESVDGTPQWILTSAQRAL